MTTHPAADGTCAARPIGVTLAGDAGHQWAFDRAVAVHPTGVGSYAGDLPSDWEVVGGPVNGGLAQAAVVAAMRQTTGPALPDPVTSTGHFLSPTVAGPFEVRLDRTGVRRRHATATGALLQGGVERVCVLATFGDVSAATGPTLQSGLPPALPPLEDCEILPAELLPPFLRRLDIRYAPGHSGGLLGRTTGATEIAAWVRFADGRPADTLSLPMLADCLPPAILNAVGAAWVPTLELTVHVRGLPAPGWLRFRFTTRHLIDGYLEEDGEIWDGSGRLVALSRQLARIRTRTADGSRAASDPTPLPPATRQETP